jgi:DNA-binding NarL/FixJ family response regulator
MLAIDELRKGLRIRYDFSGVHAVVVEPPLTSRRVLRQAMLAIGMPAPREFEEATPRPADLMADTADVLFIAASDEDPGPLRLVADIRARKIASNPFLPIVVTAFEPTPRLMRMASDAGADTIVAKPVSYKLIAERMEALVDARRPFIVTANYMGPDRRKDTRGGGIAIPGLVVPNTLAMRVHGQSMADLDVKVEEMWTTMQEQRVQRCAFQAAFLLQLLWLPDAVLTVDPAHLGELYKIQPVVGDLLARLPEGSEIAEAANPLAGEVMEIAETMASHGATPDMVSMAQGYAYRLLALVDPSHPLDRHVAIVQASVAAYRKRLAELQA